MAADPFADVTSAGGSAPTDPFADVGAEHLAPAQSPRSGTLSHHAQLAGRGLLDGTVGLLDLPSTLYTLATNKPGYASLAGRAGDALGLDRPNGLGEQLEEAGISALIPGLGAAKGLGLAADGAQALKAARAAVVLRNAQKASSTVLGSGAVGAGLKAAGAAIAGTAAADGASEAGLGPRAQAAAGLLAGAAVPGVPLAAGKVADARALAKVPADRAPVISSVVSGINDHAAGALNPGPWSASAGSYVRDGAQTLDTLSRALRDAGVISSPQARVVGNAVQQAAVHNRSVSRAEGSAYDQVANMDSLPPSVRDTLLAGIDHLDTASSSKLMKNARGPFEKAGAVTGGLIPFVGKNDVGGILEAPIGVTAGAALGRGLDRITGLAKSPAQRLAGPAQRVMQLTGTPEMANPIRAAADLHQRLLAGHPSGLFEATDGMYGSPESPSNGLSGDGFGYRQETPQPPPASPAQVPAGAPAPPPPQPPAEPPEWGPRAKGGQTLAANIFADHFRDQSRPLHAEVASAIQAAADAGLHPGAVEDLSAGRLVSPEIAHYLAGHIAKGRGLLSTISAAPDYDAEAATAINSAFGSQGSPNGPSNMGRGVDNLYRWQSAARAYQSAVDGAAQAATAAGHHAIAARLQDLKVTPKAADKQSLYETLLSTHPEAAQFVSPGLLRGIQ